MSSSLTEMTLNDRATPPSGLTLTQNQQPVAGPITIDVGILNYDSPADVALHISLDHRYLMVAEYFFNKIKWNLVVPQGVTARFDNPPIEFAEADTPTPVRVCDTVATVEWANTAPGLSFHYTIYVVVKFGETWVLVSHDPTVHNEPPTP